jgi:hypothetical protein
MKLSETPAVASWVGKIRSRDFIAKNNNPLARDPKTLNLWAYSIALLATKGIGRKMGSKT